MKKTLRLFSFLLLALTASTATMQAQEVQSGIQGKWKTSLDDEVTMIINLKADNILDLGILATPDDLDAPIAISMGGEWTFTPQAEGPGVGLLKFKFEPEKFQFDYLGSNEEIKAVFSMLSQEQLKSMAGGMTDEFDKHALLVLSVDEQQLKLTDTDIDGEMEETSEVKVFERAK